MEVADVLLEWIVPLVTLAAGFLTYQTLGGSGLFYQFTNQIPGLSSTAMSGTLAKALAAILWAGVGGLFWHLQGRLGRYGKWIARPISTFFLGSALGFAISATNNTGLPNGLIDNLVTQAQGMASGLGV